MRALLGRVFLVRGFFLSSHWVYHATPFWSARVSAEKSDDSLIGVPLYVICFFALPAFKIFCLTLILVSLISMCLGVFLLGFIFYGTRASWIWVSDSFSMWVKSSAIISWNIFFYPLTFNLYVSLEVKWVSWRRHIGGSCFCIHSASLRLLVRALSQLLICRFLLPFY